MHEPQKRACRISLVAGTRPNIVKMAPLIEVLSHQQWCDAKVMYLAQHTSPNLSQEIFEDLGVDSELVEVHSLTGSNYGDRLGSIISLYTERIKCAPPDLVVCFGDVDVTLGAALAARRACVPVAHVEAGLRSGDMNMPEEMNRLLVDSISDIFFAPSEDAYNNLVFGEAKDPAKVVYAGNIMIDSLMSKVDASTQDALLNEFGLKPKGFVVATFHRPSNVDNRESLKAIIDIIGAISSRCPVLLPIHPRTEASLLQHNLRGHLLSMKGVSVVDALRYGKFVNLLANARFVITDSGGIQEEASHLNVPCLTYRDNTERPVTIRYGTNHLVNRFDVMETVDWVLAGKQRSPINIPLWDGRTAYRIADSMRQWWGVK